MSYQTAALHFNTPKLIFWKVSSLFKYTIVPEKSINMLTKIYIQLHSHVCSVVMYSGIETFDLVFINDRFQVIIQNAKAYLFFFKTILHVKFTIFF